MAAAAGARLVEVEVVCSDAAEHRRRVEARGGAPTWDVVRARAAEYEPWDRARVVVDTAGRDQAACADDLLERVAGALR